MKENYSGAFHDLHPPPTSGPRGRCNSLHPFTRIRSPGLTHSPRPPGFTPSTFFSNFNHVEPNSQLRIQLTYIHQKRKRRGPLYISDPRAEGSPSPSPSPFPFPSNIFLPTPPPHQFPPILILTHLKIQQTQPNKIQKIK